MLKLDKKHILHRFIEDTKLTIEALMAYLMCQLKTYSAKLFGEREPTLHVKTILVFIDCNRIVRQRLARAQEHNSSGQLKTYGHCNRAEARRHCAESIYGEVQTRIGGKKATG
jgi:hypothetical protein